MTDVPEKHKQVACLTYLVSGCHEEKEIRTVLVRQGSVLCHVGLAQ